MKRPEMNHPTALERPICLGSLDASLFTLALLLFAFQTVGSSFMANTSRVGLGQGCVQIPLTPNSSCACIMLLKWLLDCIILLTIPSAKQASDHFIMNRLLYALLTILSRIYFRLVDIGFALYHRLFVPTPTPQHVSFPVRGRAEDEIYFLSATEAARAIREGRLTSSELVGAYLDRLQAVDGLVKAVVFELGEEALAQVGAPSTVSW